MLRELEYPLTYGLKPEWLGEVDRRSRDYIRWVQRSLNRIIRAGLSVDGLRGRNTRRAVRRFQRQQGLVVDGDVGSQTERALIAAGASPPPAAGTTAAAPTITAPSVNALRANVVKLANQEWSRWNRNGKIKETDPRISKVLQDYWKTGSGRRFTERDLRRRDFQQKHPWSATFISWIMKNAGAGNAFKYSAAHAVYTKAAKDNRLASNNNPIKAYRINEVKPQVGDLVCKSRAGSGATYDNIRRGHRTHCDIVTEVRPNRLTTIGGNVRDSVSKSSVSTNAAGYINKPGYIAVIRIGTPSRSGVAPHQTSPTGFIPTPVESPGGGRITNKRDPAPADLVVVTGIGGKSIHLHRLAAQAWQALVSAARADGIPHPLLLPTSGYRSSQHQARLWRDALKKYGSRREARRWVAPPGGSAHQSGRAIDFYLGGRNNSANVANLRGLPAYRWLVNNAERFGFYPYTREPWHWEYNPPNRMREAEADFELGC